MSEISEGNKLSKIKKLIIGIIIALIILFIFFVRVTYVYDLETKLPVANAQVTITHGDFWNGCGDDRNYKTNFLGMVFEFGANLTCATSIEKDGYIKNGKNKQSSIVNVIYLQKSINTPVKYYTASVFEKDGVDFLGALSAPLVPQKNPNPAFDSAPIKPVFSGLVDNTNVDVVIELIENTEKQPNVYGYGTAKVKFLGAGGIQVISDEILNSSIDEPFASLNLIAPPNGEYAKEMTIGSYKQYVVRLRDGKTYVKIFPHITKGSLTFWFTTFDNSLLPKSKDQAEKQFVEKEIKIYPNDGKILNNNDIALSGQGFKPNSQIRFYIQEINTAWSKNIESDGTWNTYFGEIVGEGSYSANLTAAETRTLLVSENNNQQKFVFSIDKNLKTRQIYFNGLVLNLPANLFIDSRDLNWIKLTDGNDKNIYSIYSKEQSYNDYLLSIRKEIIIDSSLPAGIFKISTPGKGAAVIYSFYDSNLKRSFDLLEDTGSNLNLSLNYVLSLISNAQIQK